MNFRDQFTIYFIKPVGVAGPIKIGLSENPLRRLDEFKGWSPLDLEMIGMVPGNWNDEQFLHEGLAEYHSHGEWFFPSPEVLSAVEQVISSGGVEVLRGRLKPVINLRAKKNQTTRRAKNPISQFVALPLCDETAVAQAPPRPAPSATAVSVSPITKEIFDSLNARAA